ncbi:MAG: YHS domain-containing protein [Candidatus Heimdallarchaeota archaeon]|nr:YHS domain-containing protein [Candidatus Heimdallarchaeota archaeon]
MATKNNKKDKNKAIDPVCKMPVDINKAKSNDLTSSRKGKNYYFCSNFDDNLQRDKTYPACSIQ